MNTEIQDLTKPTHYSLANNIITPAKATEDYTYILCNYFMNKPEFTQEMNNVSSGYISSQPKSISDAKK
jgi:hypothetical protein